MIGNRIIEALRHNRLSVNAIKDKVGMSQTTLNNQLREVSPLPAKTIEAVLPYLDNISAEWLLRGEGSMEKGFINQVIGRLGSCGDGDVFQQVNGDSAESDLKERIKKLEAEKERLLGIIEKLTGSKG